MEMMYKHHHRAHAAAGMRVKYSLVIYIIISCYRSMREGYAFCVRLCMYVCMYVYICVCVVKQTQLFASYRSKISTKTLYVDSSLNLLSYEDVFCAGKPCSSS